METHRKHAARRAEEPDAAKIELWFHVRRGVGPGGESPRHLEGTSTAPGSHPSHQRDHWGRGVWAGGATKEPEILTTFGDGNP